MKSGILFSGILLCAALSSCSHGDYETLQKIRNGEKQKIVVYGTSLCALESGNPPTTWPKMLADTLSSMYPDRVTIVNAAMSAMWSTWGVQNLDERVLKEKPDMVLIEFGMNDAYLPYKMSPESCRINVEYMIDRILEANPECEVVLQVMNFPIDKHLEARPDIDSYYDVYRKIAKRRRLKLIDHSTYWKEILNQGKDTYLQYVPDGIHPCRKAWEEYTIPFLIKELGIHKDSQFN